LSGNDNSYSSLCKKVVNFNAGSMSLEEEKNEVCPIKSKCLSIEAENINVLSSLQRKTYSGKLAYGGCIKADVCDDLSCDKFLPTLSFGNYSFESSSSEKCEISCCSGELCNSKQTAKTENGCSGYSLDLMFLLDGSGSLTESEFNLQKEFVKKSALQLDFAEHQIGIMQYSHWFKWRSMTSADQTFFETHIPLGQPQNFQEFSDSMDQIRPHGFTAYVGHAVEKAIVEDLTKSHRFLQDCTKKAIVVVIDGKASDSRYLKTSNRLSQTYEVNMIGVGVDQYRKKELQVLINGNKGLNRNILSAKSFSKLDEQVDLLVGLLQKLTKIS